MNRPLLFSTVLLAGFALVAGAQNPAPARRSDITLADVAGTWEGKSMVGPNDSVFATWVLTATADGKSWTEKFPNRDPLPLRVTAMGGDSIVTEMGPYSSVLRRGQMVTTRRVGHFKGNRMTGSFEAHYAAGDVVRGKIEATREK
jgi:hypothetical protein